MINGVLLSVCLTCCNKYNKAPNDLGGSLYISGRAFELNNYAMDSLYTPLANHLIEIKSLNDPTSNFIYSTYSDSSGNFTFTNITMDSSYQVLATDTMNNIQFSGSLNFSVVNASIGNVVLVLLVDTTLQNGFVYTATDSLTNIIPGVRLCVVANPVIAMIDTDTTCLGDIFQGMTNSFGKVSDFNMHAATYSAIFYGYFNGITYKATRTLTINPVGVFRDTVILSQQ